MNVENRSHWPTPKTLPDPQELQAPTFPMEFLPGAFGARVKDVSERIHASPDIAAIAMIVQVATAAGNNVRIRMKEKDSWTARPVVWGAIVAPPATYKTPVVDEIWSLWRHLEGVRADEFKAKQLEYKQACEHARMAKKLWETKCREKKKTLPMPEEAIEPPKPKLARLMVNDITLEALIDVLQSSDGHLAVVADELAGVFKRFNQYRSGGDREFYLSLHAGSSYAYDRKSAGSVLLLNPFANILGGIQPSKLPLLVEDTEGDGLTARFSLLIWPKEPSKFEYVDRQPDNAAKQAVSTAIRRVLELRSGTEFRFSSDAQRIFIDWYTEHRNRLLHEQGLFRAHLGKYDSFFGTLCIVHHLMLGRSSEKEVGDDTANAVEALIEDYLIPHAKKVYSYASEFSTYAAARRLGDWLLERPDKAQFTLRDVRQLKWRGLGDDASITRALRVLIAKKWLRRVTKVQTGGRPTDKYLVNPGIHDL